MFVGLDVHKEAIDVSISEGVHRAGGTRELFVDLEWLRGAAGYRVTAAHECPDRGRETIKI